MCRLEERLRGLVIRETNYGESDKILTVLTAEKGCISVMAKAARSLKSQYSYSSQLMCYSEMTLYCKGDSRYLREAIPIETFYSLRLELDRYALAQYMFEICCEVCREGQAEEAGNVLRITLNALYALMNDIRPQEQIKAAFEFRVAVVSGYAPDLTGCVVCGARSDSKMYLDVVNGVFRCSSCVAKTKKEDGDTYHATPVAIFDPYLQAVLQHIALSDPKRYLLFSVNDRQLKDLGKLCELYICNQLERGFETLNFWHEMRRRYSE